MFLARTVKTKTWNVQTTSHILDTNQKKKIAQCGVPWNIHVASQVYQTGIFSIKIILANVTASPSAFPHVTLLHCSPPSQQNMLYPVNININNINNMNIFTNTEIREVVQCPEVLKTELLKELWLEGGGCGHLKGRSKERTLLGFSPSFSSILYPEIPYCNVFVVCVVCLIILCIQILPSKNCWSCLLGWKYLSFYWESNQQGRQKEEGMW